MKHSVYHQDGAVIFFDLNFSLKREEPFCILRRSTQLHLNPHNNLECSHEFYGEIILANEVCGSTPFLKKEKKILKYLKVNHTTKIMIGSVMRDMKVAGPLLLFATRSCRLDKHQRH